MFDYLILTLCFLGFMADEPMAFGNMADEIVTRPAEGRVEFNRDIRPILSQNCFACHGFDAAKREAGLRLDVPPERSPTAESNGSAIRPGDPETSELIRRIMSDEEDCMPPSDSGKKLSLHEKQLLHRWIEQGAEYQSHWAFAPIGSPAPPMPSTSSLRENPVKIDPATMRNEIGEAAWEHPIDAFVRDECHRQGLQPSPLADPMTLLRRVSLDLIGLPPTLEELETFADDYARRGEIAYAEWVDRLLMSPHYGERWGRWWLDQARYADSHGYSVDAPREIWLYRDWVVEAWNRDLPLDQFAIQQLAGDLLPEASNATRIATGFHRNTQVNQEGGIDPEQFRIESVFDRVATTGTVFLGLTLGCAQCHDHKFDPITQKEYYQFFAFFNQQDEPSLTVYPPEVDEPKLTREKRELESQLHQQLEQHQTELKAWEANLDEETRAKLTADHRKALALEPSKRSASQRYSLYLAGPGSSDAVSRSQVQRLEEIAKALSRGIKTLVLQERDKPRNTHRFVQGDFTRPAEEVACGTPNVLHAMASEAKQPSRLTLAQWIASPANPLTPRVMVNRVWQQFFGRGLVETDNDFGMQGSPPSHPRLLDWLARDWLEHGCRWKHLHRRIVMSQTYQQTSVETPVLRERDPQNIWLARQRRLRLDAEIVRDVALVASGLFDATLGGPPVFPPIPPGVMTQGQVQREWKVSVGGNRYRRGLYTFLYRSTPPPSLNVFDAPEGNSSCTRRMRSNTPLQALTLLNDTAFFEFAEGLAKIVEREGTEAAFRRCTGRRPRLEELSVLKHLDPLGVARVLLNLDETVTRE